MSRITIGLIALGFGVVGGLVHPAEARLINRCNVSAQVNLMPGVGVTDNDAPDGDEDRSRPVDCRGRPSGPRHQPTFDDLPEPEVDVYLNV